MFSSHVKELKNLRAASDIAAKQLCGPGESRTPDLLVANEAL